MWSAPRRVYADANPAIDAALVDYEHDLLNGSSGSDWYLNSVGDTIIDPPENRGRHQVKPRPRW
jgi:hypothetical protein